MRRTALLSIFILLVLLSTSSNLFGQKLTENLAIGLIRKAVGYPKLLSITLDFFTETSPIKQEILRLVQEGFIEDKYGNLVLTEKGKSIITWCSWNFVYKRYDLTIYSHYADVVNVEEMLTDSQTGIAIIRYKIGFTPTPYLLKLMDIDRKRVEDRVESEKKGNRYFQPIRQIYLKKYDQGWRVVSEEQGG